MNEYRLKMTLVGLVIFSLPELIVLIFFNSLVGNAYVLFPILQFWLWAMTVSESPLDNCIEEDHYIGMMTSQALSIIPLWFFKNTGEGVITIELIISAVFVLISIGIAFSGRRVLKYKTIVIRKITGIHIASVLVVILGLAMSLYVLQDRSAQLRSSVYMHIVAFMISSILYFDDTMYDDFDFPKNQKILWNFAIKKGKDPIELYLDNYSPYDDYWRRDYKKALKLHPEALEIDPKERCRYLAYGSEGQKSLEKLQKEIDDVWKR